MKKLLNYLLFISLMLVAAQNKCFAQPQSMYVKNNSGCTVEVVLRGHASSPSPYDAPCILVSSVFTVGGSGDITFPDVTTLDCSSCSPSWAGGPYSLVAGSGSGWDGAFIRAFCPSPPTCAPWNSLGPCFSTTTISVMGCTSVSADWVYDAINDQWEIAIY